MPQKRCQACSNCKKLNAAQDAKAAKKLRLSCTKTKRRTEADLLGANVIGGEFSEAPNQFVFASPREEKRPHPEAGAMGEIGIDEELFARYSTLVTACETVGASMTKTSDAIAQEYNAIMSKIKYDDTHIHPSAEVDYNDQVFIVSGIMHCWSKRRAAGTTAFCPPIEYAVAFEETVSRMTVEQEWHTEFGQEGAVLLDEILANIEPEVEPRVVTCFLRDLLDKLRTTEDDLTFWTLDDYLKETEGSSQSNGLSDKQKISRQALFSRYLLPEKSISNAVRAEEKTNEARTSTIGNGERPKTARKSKLHLLGKTLRSGFQRAASERKVNQKKANRRVDDLIASANFDPLSKRELKSCTSAARAMEDVLFRQGGMHRVFNTLVKFNSRPAAREATKARAKAGLGKDCESKLERLNRVVFAQLKLFFELFNTHKGPRTNEDQNAVNVALTALTTSDGMKSERLGKALQKAMGVTYRHLKRAATIREDLEDMDTAHWVRASKQQYLNAIPDEAKALVTEWLHSDEASVVDNLNKHEFLISLGLSPTDQQIYDLHEARRLIATPTELFDKLTGRNRAQPNDPREPSECWKRVQELTATPKRPNGMKGSLKFFKKCMCKCLRQFKVNVCSCPKCTSFEENLTLYNRARSEWYRIAKKQQNPQDQRIDTQGINTTDHTITNDRPRRSTTTDRPFKCQTCKNNVCSEKSIYRLFSKSPQECQVKLLCKKTTVAKLSLPKLDINGNETSEIQEFKMFQKTCCNGSHVAFDRSGPTGTKAVLACGWDATFQDCPKWKLKETNARTGDTIEKEMRGCEVEMTNDAFVWKEWVTVKRPTRSERLAAADDDETYGDDGVSTMEEWLPVRGTRKQFLFKMKAWFMIYNEHQWRIRIDRQNRRREIRAYLHLPAVVAVPQSTKGVVFAQADFSSVLFSTRAHDKTCTHPESHNCNVVHLTFDPRVVPVSEIRKVSPIQAKKLEEQGVTQIIKCRNVVIYGMSKMKGSAAYHHVQMDDIRSILKDGKLLDTSKGEGFMNGMRLPGGNKQLQEAPWCLPVGLKEWEGEPTPLYSEAERMQLRRDGCAGQYQGLCAFLGCQTFQARNHGFGLVDKRCVECHGKCTCDGLTHTLKGNIHRSSHDNYEAGTRGLVHHLAAKYQTPNLSRKTRYYKGGTFDGSSAGLFSPDLYIYIYYPDDAFDGDTVSAKAGYKGSSKDFYYESHGHTIEESELVHRNMTCTCQSCLEQDVRKCQLTSLFGRLQQNVKIPRAVPVRAPETRTGRTLESFCKELKKGSLVIVRIAGEESQMYADMDYFVAKIEEAPRKLTKGETHGSNLFLAGWYVAKIRWFEKESVTNTGHGIYYLSSNCQVIQCNAFIRSITREVELQYVRRSRRYMLDRALDEHILKFGTFSI